MTPRLPTLVLAGVLGVLAGCGGDGTGADGTRLDFSAPLERTAAETRPVPTVATTSAEGDPERLVFVLAGQSNMAGRGRPVPKQTLDPQILSYTPTAGLKRAKDPLDLDSNKSIRGVGPGIPFANGVLKQHPDATIILVPCARGGSAMKRWMPGGDLLERCFRYARGLLGTDPDNRLAGWLFAQGEADTVKKADATRWRGRFEAMVDELRTQLEVPDLPVVHTVVGPVPPRKPTKNPYWRTLQRAQRKVDLEGVAHFETEDLPLQDELHFTVRGYHRLGGRFGKAWEALEAGRVTP